MVLHPSWSWFWQRGLASEEVTRHRRPSVTGTGAEWVRSPCSTGPWPPTAKAASTSNYLSLHSVTTECFALAYTGKYYYFLKSPPFISISYIDMTWQGYTKTTRDRWILPEPRAFRMHHSYVDHQQSIWNLFLHTWAQNLLPNGFRLIWTTSVRVFLLLFLL